TQVELGLRVTHPAFVEQRRLRAEADQTFVRVGMLLVEVMHVVGGHGFQPELPGELKKTAVYLALLGNAVVMQFEIEIVGTENVSEFIERVLRLIERALRNLLRYLALEARRETYEAF